MSGAVKQRGTAPSAPFNKSVPDTVKMENSNGNGAQFGTLSYPAELSDDLNMNEVDGLVTLNVTLPSGKAMDINIDYNTPMLDLLVSVAGKSKLNPSGLSLQLISEDTGKPLAYKPNQTIGALGGRVVHIVSKSDSLGKDKFKGSKKKQPFEMTHRFTINLPRGQKAVSRVSPITTLGEMMTSVCKDKGLDPHRHILQLPAQPGIAVDPAATVGQIGIFEMNLVNLANQDKRNQALSMPDLSQVPQMENKFPTYMPGGETKKKKGFFSFLSKKEKKFKPNDALYNMETSSTTSHMMSSAQSRKLAFPPNARRGSDAGTEKNRPKSMFVASPAKIELESSKSSQNEDKPSNAVAPVRKKRKAPAPPVPQPKQAESVTENISSKQEHIQDGNLHKEGISDVNRVNSSNQKDVNSTISTSGQSRAEMLSRLHSRNSSDSSGYHELTLSGCESPEAAHGIIKSKISIDSTSIESADNTNGDSGINESPVRVSPIEEVLEKSDTIAVAASEPPRILRSDSLSATGTLTSKKKKKAPAPPPLSIPPPTKSPEILPTQEQPQPQPVQDLPQDTGTESRSMPEPEDVQISTDVVEITQLAVMDMNEDDDVSFENVQIDDEDTGFDINDILSNVKFDDEPAPFRHIAMAPHKDVNGADDDGMMMVETTSISSENIEQIDFLSKSDRPCAFVPPPPPVEPPPPDEPDIDISYLNSSLHPVFVDKGTEVNDDNTSLAPSSVKNSPEIVSPDGYKTEMALFVERMSQMAAESPQEGSNHLNDSIGSGISAPGSDSNSDTGSVIRHVRNDSHDSKSSSETGSLRYKDLKSVTQSEQSFSPPLEDQRRETAFAISEEITLPVETVPPPPEFDDGGMQANVDESDDEEIIETLEEIIIPFGPNGYDFSSAKKVSESTTILSKENKRDEKLEDYGVFRAEPVSIAPVTEPISKNYISQAANAASNNEPTRISTTRVEESTSFTPIIVTKVQPQQSSLQSKPAAKEEFVLTTEDLSNVTFLPPKQKSVTQSTKVQETDSHPASTTLIMTKSSSQQSQIRDRSDSYSRNIQNRVSQINFSPRPESEANSMLEEKPIALLNMSSMKVTVQSESDSSSDDDTYNRKFSISSVNPVSVDQSNFSQHNMPNTDQDYTDSSSYLSQSAPDADAVDYYDERPNSRASATSFNLSDQQEELQTQYNGLQLQFTQWQEQLRRNQSMLATENAGEAQPEERQQLANQMAMQQEMMMNLQSTMQSLQLQQEQQQQEHQMNGTNERKSEGVELKQTANAAEPPLRAPIPPVPPPPPAPPMIDASAIIKSKVQLKPVQASKARGNPKFERQLDPKEELMVAIRNFSGRENLRSVPAKDIKWIHTNRL